MEQQKSSRVIWASFGQAIAVRIHRSRKMRRLAITRWGLVALRAVVPGDVVVCAGIHMSDIPSFPNEVLWEERQIWSVAKLNRRDGEEFLELASKVPLKTSVSLYGLEQANDHSRI